MLLSRVLAVLFLLVSSAACADSINANMSNSTAQFEAGFSSGGNAEIQTGVFYTDQGNSRKAQWNSVQGTIRCNALRLLTPYIRFMQIGRASITNGHCAGWNSKGTWRIDLFA